MFLGFEDLSAFRRSVREFLSIPEASAPTIEMPSLATSTSATNVYLDHLHWIGLAQARLGQEAGAKFKDVYDVLLEGTKAGTIRVVLSAMSYTELHASVRSPSRRTDLADVMSELSRYWAIRPTSQLLEAQFLQSLHDHLGRPTFPPQQVVFGRGLYWVYEGKEKRLGIRLPEGMQIHYIDEVADEFQAFLEYCMLRGNNFATEDGGLGYDISPLVHTQEERVAKDRELQQMLASDPKLRARLDDIIVARELYHEIGPELPRLLAAAGISMESFFHRGREWITKFMMDLPIIAVNAAIRDQTMRAANRYLVINDLRDLGHLSVAVPYCDIVVTDRDAASAIRRAGLDKRLNTEVLSDLTMLPAVVP
jgi:hypothetical protein